MLEIDTKSQNIKNNYQNPLSDSFFGHFASRRTPQTFFKTMMCCLQQLNVTGFRFECVYHTHTNNDNTLKD
ncbi:hypothetical protein HanPI659440_Chr12g0466751 [Helianthus annuus]|nr:hypothetical protein HanPI659440_Chr12g0466751 [Helianthus annuus]